MRSLRGKPAGEEPALASRLVSGAFGFDHALPQRIRLVLLTGYVSSNVEKINDKCHQIHLLDQWDCFHINLDTVTLPGRVIVVILRGWDITRFNSFNSIKYGKHSIRNLGPCLWVKVNTKLRQCSWNIPNIESTFKKVVHSVYVMDIRCNLQTRRMLEIYMLNLPDCDIFYLLTILLSFSLIWYYLRTILPHCRTMRCWQFIYLCIIILSSGVSVQD